MSAALDRNTVHPDVLAACRIIHAAFEVAVARKKSEIAAKARRREGGSLSKTDAELARTLRSEFDVSRLLSNVPPLLEWPDEKRAREALALVVGSDRRMFGESWSTFVELLDRMADGDVSKDSVDDAFVDFARVVIGDRQPPLQIRFNMLRTA